MFNILAAPHQITPPKPRPSSHAPPPVFTCQSPYMEEQPRPWVSVTLLLQFRRKTSTWTSILEHKKEKTPAPSNQCFTAFRPEIWAVIRSVVNTCRLDHLQWVYLWFAASRHSIVIKLFAFHSTHQLWKLTMVLLN